MSLPENKVQSSRRWARMNADRKVLRSAFICAHRRLPFLTYLYLVTAIGGSLLALAANAEPTVTVGSKAFTESVLLGEVLVGLARDAGAKVAHRAELGGSQVLFGALKAGEVDVYPDYTGTIAKELLGGNGGTSDDAIRAQLAEQGVLMSRPVGFNNTYVIGMLTPRAAALGIETISDLASHSDLRLGFSDEFMERSDGWAGLRARYELPHRRVRGMDHNLAYRGLASGSLDVIDLYSTDPEIESYEIRPLSDDRKFFPVYDAVILYREDLSEHAPEVVESILLLEGAIDAPTMIAMNLQARVQRLPESQVAARFLQDSFGVVGEAQVESKWRRRLERLGRNTREHLLLVAVSLSAAVLFSVPLGVLAYRRPKLAKPILGVVGVIQTLPSLALLVFMIPLLGLGAEPAIVALFLYSLLPIVRNTYTGLTQIPGPLREAAEVLGLPPRARLWKIELPLASPSILAGVKTAAVINIGAATLGALIGAGGYGQPILTGIRLADTSLILQGAIPAAAMALAAQGLFGWTERWLVPAGLRIEPAS